MLCAKYEEYNSVTMRGKVPALMQFKKPWVDNKHINKILKDCDMLGRE